jgi:hypothetical protein
MTVADLLGDAAVDIDTDKIDDAVLAGTPAFSRPVASAQPG